MIIQLSKDKNIYIFHKVSQLDIANSIRQLSIMLRSGMAIEESLEILVDQATDAMLKGALTTVLNDVKSGKPIAESMKKYPKIFSDIVVSIIEVGEKGASLENNLMFLAEYLKKMHDVQSKIKGAMVYPLVIMAMTFVEMIGLIYYFLPKLDSLYTSIDDPPIFTTVVLNLTTYIRTHTPLVAGVLIGTIILINVFLGTSLGKKFKDWLALNMPVFKRLTTTNILMTFSRTLGILLANGIPIQKALLITQETIGNQAYSKALTKASEDLKSGQNLAQVISYYPKLFPITYVKMIEIGEKTGSLEDNLKYLYELYTDEVNELTDNITTLLEPFMLIIIGGLVLVMALAVIAPIYQLTGSINSY